MVDISKVVLVDFNVEHVQASIGSYKNVLYVTTASDSHATEAQTVFTQLGGDANRVNVLELANSSDGSAIATQIFNAKKAVSGTAEDFIFVVIDPLIASFPYADMLNAIYTGETKFIAPNHVIVCVGVACEDSFPPDNLAQFGNYPIAVKLYNQTGGNAQAVMSIPAYYANINLNYTNSVADYCYTDESAAFGTADYVTLASDNYDAATQANCNWVDKIANQVVNFGGNLMNGTSITAQFGAIAAENDVVFAVLNAMLKKQYLTNGGLNNVVSYIHNALSRYVTNGFLQQNANYAGDTYVSGYNGQSITLIKNGALLPVGYFVGTINMSYLSAEDRAAHRFTPIYVFMQTQAGARVVEISGTIIE